MSSGGAPSGREALLSAFAEGVPYVRWLGVGFDLRGEELTGVLRYDPKLIGNARRVALHGGVTAAFLEMTAVIEIAWTSLCSDPEATAPARLRVPKTIDLTVDYLRPGLPQDAFARARIIRWGRRYASVHVEAWQDARDRLFAQATGHFLMPQSGD